MIFTILKKIERGEKIMSERIDERRVDRALAIERSGVNSSFNEWWFDDQIRLLGVARDVNQSTFTTLGSELDELTSASERLVVILDNNVGLADHTVDSHNMIKESRFRGSNRVEFTDKLEVFRNRLNSLRRHVTNMKDTKIAFRITRIRETRASIKILRANQQSDIEFLTLRRTIMMKIGS